MNILSQHTRKLWLIQIISNILSFYKQPQIENTNILTNKLLDVIVKIAITFLCVLSFTGILKLIFEFITNPSQFSNTAYGIFDYI